jgi:hypothetical protein
MLPEGPFSGGKNDFFIFLNFCTFQDTTVEHPYDTEANFSGKRSRIQGAV